MKYFFYALRNYANFKGRATRREFWWYQLFLVITYFVYAIILGLFVPKVEDILIWQLVLYVAVLVPTFAIGVRRLHDTGRAGWWMLLAFLPLLGLILLVYFMEKSKPEINEFGSVPHYDDVDSFGRKIRLR